MAADYGSHTCWVLDYFSGRERCPLHPQDCSCKAFCANYVLVLKVLPCIVSSEAIAYVQGY